VIVPTIILLVLRRKGNVRAQTCSLCPPLQYSKNMTASKQLLINFTSTSGS